MDTVKTVAHHAFILFWLITHFLCPLLEIDRLREIATNVNPSGWSLDWRCCSSSWMMSSYWFIVSYQSIDDFISIWFHRFIWFSLIFTPWNHHTLSVFSILAAVCGGKLPAPFLQNWGFVGKARLSLQISWVTWLGQVLLQQLRCGNFTSLRTQGLPGWKTELSI